MLGRLSLRCGSYKSWREGVRSMHDKDDDQALRVSRKYAMSMHRKKGGRRSQWRGTLLGIGIIISIQH
jgi:hypothetical protein